MDEKWRWATRFEFDERKSRVNRLKHGIDFVEAQALWRDPRLSRIPAGSASEQRFLVIGRFGGRHWSAVITMRGDAVGLISVRRSRAREVEAYEGQ